MNLPSELVERSETASVTSSPVVEQVESVNNAASTVEPIAATPQKEQQKTMGINVGEVSDTILHDILLMGALAASIFVKNPAHQQTAGLLINAVNQMIQVLDPQLLGTKPIVPVTTPAPTA